VRIKSQRDFFSGLLFIALGIAFAWGASTLRIGSSASMGAGYFPLAMGVVLAAIGAFIVFGSLVVETEDGEPPGPWAVRPLVGVLVGSGLFAALIAGVPALGLPPMGLVVAAVALVICCSLATGPGFRLKETVALSVVLAAVACGGATLLMARPLPLWPVMAG
jgi:hypothetical protein